MSFYQKLKTERDRTYHDKDKAKGLYDDSCMEIQNIRNKIAKGTGDQEKVIIMKEWILSGIAKAYTFCYSIKDNLTMPLSNATTKR